MNPEYLLAFVTGVAGGFGHCIGMCGPIVASYALANAGGSRASFPVSALPHLFYNAGRVITYAAIGAFMGLTGSFINVTGKLAGIQNTVSVLAGCLMIVMGFGILGNWSSAGWIEKHNLPVLRSALKLQTVPSFLRPLLLGLVLGLLPCGLSYTIFIAAAGSGSALAGMNISLLFGLGTLPALLAFGSLVSVVGISLRTAIYRTGGVLVILMGGYYLWKGIRTYAGL